MYKNRERKIPRDGASGRLNYWNRFENSDTLLIKKNRLKLQKTEKTVFMEEKQPRRNNPRMFFFKELSICYHCRRIHLNATTKEKYCLLLPDVAMFNLVSLIVPTVFNFTGTMRCVKLSRPRWNNFIHILNVRIKWTFYAADVPICS